MVFSKQTKRAAHVVRVLVRNGLEWVVEEYGLRWHVPFFKPKPRPDSEKESVQRRLRHALEELGGSFIKLGQMLSLREDLIPHEYADEFKKLLDEVPAQPFSEIKKVIEREFGKPVDKIFRSIEEKPIGSASIAQVHRAVLPNGTRVVVKIRRAYVAESFQADIELLYYLARKIAPRLQDTVSPIDIVEEFERYTNQELNFTNEANNIDVFYRQYRHVQDVRIPKVFWNYCTKQVLVIEYLEGVKLSHVSVKNPQRIAKRIIDTSIFQVFELGVFHADMHPGNILMLPRHRLGLIDFGIVGRLSEDLREKGTQLWIAMSSHDIDGMVRTLTDMGFARGPLDLEAFRKSVFDAMRDWRHPSEHGRRPSHVLRLLFNTCMKYKISLPVDIILLAKAFLTTEGTCLSLDPSFDFYRYANVKAEEIARRQFEPANLAHQVFSKAKELSNVAYQIPVETLHLLDHIKHGRFNLDIEDTDIRHLGSDINKSSNRLSFALLISALALTGAITINIGPMFGHVSFISLVFFGLALFFCAPLVVSILREGSEEYDPHRS
ncbi:hypothetical protein GF342_02855 [Candidatus Woesearchaeota archaeon]|nr:hypothetical protein [Candidatus Woesearchaeota archaeon]